MRGNPIYIFSKYTGCPKRSTSVVKVNINTIVLGAAIIAGLPSVALAQDQVQRLFAGLDVIGGVVNGSSSTTNGGGVPPIFEGEGVVRDVKFGSAFGLGGHIGYRLDSNWSVYASYQHIHSGISWSADYPSAGIASNFSGDAFSNVLMGNVAYAHIVSDETAIILKAGLGVSLNTLAGITETQPANGSFIADLADHTQVSPAAQIGVGVEHRLASNVSLGLNAAFAYAGSFKTGDTRTGNLGVTAINPYEIENVWRGSLGASLKVSF